MASIAQISGAAPIITEGSTVSTTAVEIEYDILNHNNAQGAYYAGLYRYATADGDINAIAYL